MSAVPQAYRGVWKRSVLEQDGRRDTATQVWWLQTARWHADLRLPAHRPDFSGVQSVAQCTREHLDWLLQQEGFAGVTEVAGDQCIWHRRYDFRPTGWPDIGRMRFGRAGLEETGVVQAYFEHWEKVPASESPLAAHRSHRPAEVRLLLRAGMHFLYLAVPMPDAREVLWQQARAGTATIAAMRRLAEFEISFGRIDGTEWQIRHSTLPWREGALLTLEGAWKNLDAEEEETV